MTSYRPPTLNICVGWKARSKKFEITTDIIGHEEEDKKQIKVLKKFIAVKDSGYTYEHVRHSDMIVKELGLQGAQTLSTPVSDMHHESEELLDHEKVKKYQSLRARANFFAQDRIDLQLGAKDYCRPMSRPTVRDWSKLKRTDRFLASCPRCTSASSRRSKRC